MRKLTRRTIGLLLVVAHAVTFLWLAPTHVHLHAHAHGEQHAHGVAGEGGCQHHAGHDHPHAQASSAGDSCPDAPDRHDHPEDCSLCRLLMQISLPVHLAEVVLLPEVALERPAGFSFRLAAALQVAPFSRGPPSDLAIA